MARALKPSIRTYKLRLAMPKIQNRPTERVEIVKGDDISVMVAHEDSPVFLVVRNNGRNVFACPIERVLDVVSLEDSQAAPGPRISVVTPEGMHTPVTSLTRDVT